MMSFSSLVQKQSEGLAAVAKATVLATADEAKDLYYLP
jgi:hypothetical protein